MSNTAPQHYAFYERFFYDIGIIDAVKLKARYDGRYYLLAFLVAFLIGMGCALPIGYFVILSSGTLWLGYAVGLVTLTLNCYLYFADTIDWLHTVSSGNFLKELKHSCAVAAEKSGQKAFLCLSSEQLYVFKKGLLGLIFLLVVADGLANAAFAFMGTQHFFTILGGFALAAGPLPYVFALASLVGNIAIIFVTLRKILLEPKAIFSFIKNIYNPPLGENEQKDWRYQLKCVLRVTLFIAAFVGVSVATLAITAVWRKDFGAFLISVLGCADALAYQLSMVIIWGLGLLPELAFAWRCAGNVTDQLTWALFDPKKRYNQWKDARGFDAATTHREVACAFSVDFSKLLVKITLITINAIGNSLVSRSGASILEPMVSEQAVTGAGLLNSWMAMGNATGVFDQPTKDVLSTHEALDEQDILGQGVSLEALDEQDILEQGVAL